MASEEYQMKVRKEKKFQEVEEIFKAYEDQYGGDRRGSAVHQEKNNKVLKVLQNHNKNQQVTEVLHVFSDYDSIVQRESEGANDTLIQDQEYYAQEYEESKQEIENVIMEEKGD